MKGDAEGRKLGHRKGNRLAAYYQASGAGAFMGIFCVFLPSLGFRLVLHFWMRSRHDRDSAVCVSRVNRKYCYQSCLQQVQVICMSSHGRLERGQTTEKTTLLMLSCLSPATHGETSPWRPAAVVRGPTHRSVHFEVKERQSSVTPGTCGAPWTPLPCLKSRGSL